MHEQGFDHIIKEHDALGQNLLIKDNSYAHEIKCNFMTIKGRTEVQYNIANESKDAFLNDVMTLKAVIDAVPEAIAVVSEKGSITLWNAAAEKFFGYAQEEILENEFHKLLEPEAQLHPFSQALSQIIKKDISSGRIRELHARHKDGNALNIELSLSALKIRNARFAVIIAKKRPHEETEISSLNYYQLVENAPIGILSCDTEGNIDFVNQKALDILGSVSIEETKKINLLTFPLLIKHGFSQKLKECLKNKKPMMLEFHYESKWGKKVWLRTHTKPLVNGSAVTGAQVIIDDIGEKKQLEAELFFLSITDTLTNAYNRRYFIDKLEKEIQRVKRKGGNFSVILYDYDHFKSINDIFGHHYGDCVLKEITSAIMNKIRKIDTLARWGVRNL